MYRQKLNSTQRISVCWVKAESSKKGKLERKYLLQEGRQLRKQSTQKAVDIHLVTSLCFKIVYWGEPEQAPH